MSAWIFVVKNLISKPWIMRTLHILVGVSHVRTLQPRLLGSAFHSSQENRADLRIHLVVLVKVNALNIMFIPPLFCSVFKTALWGLP